MATTAQVTITATPTPVPHAVDGGGLTTGQVVIWVLLIAVVTFVGWRISLFLHPWRHCRKCDSNPRSYGEIYTGSFAICGHCGGTGRELRFGAKDR